MKTDIVIVGTGVSGLYCALNLPRDKKIVMVTKADDDKSDSFLAQGGICVLKDENVVAFSCVIYDTRCTSYVVGKVKHFLFTFRVCKHKCLRIFFLYSL